jgi:EAL domain-containing protein (putative c-di-GMP-specific phosphodiesterase class I)
VPPGVFIPAAEASGMMVPLGTFVVREACRQIRAWRDAGLEPPPVAVNISPAQFRDAAIVPVVHEALEAAALDTDALVVELTESSLMRDVDYTELAVRALADAGVRIALDDFGTGYSSLAYLKRFPISTLKVDRAFVADVTRSRRDGALARAIVALGHSLGMGVVAEGIETAAQRDLFREFGCDVGQGYLFARPLEPSRAVQLIAPRDDRRAA